MEADPLRSGQPADLWESGGAVFGWRSRDRGELFRARNAPPEMHLASNSRRKLKTILEFGMEQG